MRTHQARPKPALADRGLAFLLLTSVLSAVFGGAALGAMAGPVGVAWGLVLGLGFGLIIGKGMTTEERARIERTRQLDDIIGVTKGSLGAEPSSLVSPAPEMPADGEVWLAEWLTPPPPAAS